jgi:uncharacterized protein (TIGR03545 family)
MKKAKISGVFRKKYKEKAFNKKILKRIHIPKEREKIASLFEKNENDRFVLIGDIPDATLKKLKPLAKSIKKNKGLITTWKAVIILIIVGSVLVFNFLFKDKLIEKVVESGLESVFEAEADIEGAHLSLLKGIISYESLTIADVDKPMYNLIETGRAELQISIKELAFKRVFIEEISMNDVMWNSLRDSDGSLDRENSPEEEGSIKDSSSVMDTLSLNPGEFDYQTLLEKQKDKLQSLQLIEDSNKQIEDIRTRWSGIFNEKETEINTLSNKISTVKSINLNNIKSIDDAQAQVAQIKSFYPEVEKFKDSVSSLNSDFNSEKSQILSMGNSINSGINSDLDFLVDSLDFSLGDITSISSGLAEDYIRARWNSYYEYGLKAWDIFKRFQNRDKKEPKVRTGLNRASGRNVLFPSPLKPSFFIRHIGLTGGEKKSGHLSMEVSSISNEPDKTTDPTALDILYTQENSVLDLKGILDLKKDSSVIFQMNVNVPGNPVKLEQGIPSLGISSISSTADISGTARAVRGESSLHTELNVILSDINPVQTDNDSFLSGTVKELFSKNNQIGLTGEIEIDRDGIESVSVQSDFDKMIYDSLGGYLADQKDKITDELKDNLLNYINPELEKNQLLSSSLDALGVQSLNQISSVNQFEAVLDSKISELENRGDAIAAELKAQAEAQVQAEADSILDKAKESIKLPGF